MEDNTKLISNLIENISYRQKRLEEMRLDMRKDTEELIVACVGLNIPLTFNDETGFPYYNDDCETSPEPIVGVRVTGDEDTMTGYCLEFNLNCGDDEYGLNPDTWFCPYDHGTYDDGQLLTGIDNWINQNKEK